MKDQLLIIEYKTELKPGIYAMKLRGDMSEISAPGQFINIKAEGFYLRRPISICDWDSESLTVIFRIAGQGTKAIAAMDPGEKLDVLMPLGNGFDVANAGQKPLIVGGGIGVPPLYGLALRLIKSGKRPTVVLGFNSMSDIILDDVFSGIGIEPVITTVDGSAGYKGFVTDVMDDIDYDYVFTCGPEPMLEAVYGKAPDGQFSFEARMACGFGACMGCTCETKYGYKRICKDGPVLVKEEIKW